MAAATRKRAKANRDNEGPAGDLGGAYFELGEEYEDVQQMLAKRDSWGQYASKVKPFGVSHSCVGAFCEAVPTRRLDMTKSMVAALIFLLLVVPPLASRTVSDTLVCMPWGPCLIRE